MANSSNQPRQSGSGFRHHVLFWLREPDNEQHRREFLDALRKMAAINVIEEYARAMLEQDKSLQKEFEEKKASDEKFAADPRSIRRWFYQRTPFWDDHIGLYPVGLIYERSLLESMPR